MQQYGIRIICDYGDTCAGDSDSDGHCDVDDCCPWQFNGYWNCQDDDGDGLPACADNCPTVPNADQLDFDGDGIGNECDTDADGDGVENDLDCDEFNPLLTWDTDGDRVCEHPPWTQTGHNSCRAQCTDVQQQVQDEYGYLPPSWNSYVNGCLSRCDAYSDNCADGPETFTTAACDLVHEFLQTGRSIAEANGAELQAFQDCKDLFFNPSQASGNPGVVGDKCATYALDLQLDTGHCGATTADVSFRTNAEPLTGSVDMQGTSVEWCHCSNLDATLDEWHEDCFVNYCDKHSRDRWNPIRSPSFAAGLGYPTSPTDDLNKQVFTLLHEMGRDRRFEFRRDPASNLHQLAWDWQTTKLYPYTYDWSNGYAGAPVLDAEVQTIPGVSRPLKARVSWNPTVIEHPAELPAGQVVLSEGVRYLTPAEGCPHHGLDFAERFDWFWWLTPGPLETPRLDYLNDPSPIGWAAVEGPADPLRLVVFDRSLATPTAVKPVTYLPGSTETASLAGMSTCAGQLDSALVGQTHGKTGAVFAYGVPAGEARPKLWIGLVGTPDNLWMTGQQAFGPHEEPRVGSPLFFDEQSQTLFVLGEATGGGTGAIDRNTLMALDFNTGLWQSWGRILALGDATDLSVSFDPVQRRILAFGGQVDGQATQRVVAVSLEALSAAVLWSGDASIPDLSRSAAGAYYDPFGQMLYVYGGERDGRPLGDTHAFDVRRRTWTALSTYPTQGPGPRIKPKVLYERRRGRLWVAQTYGAQSLVVLDVSDPAQPAVVAGVFLPGLCRSVAVRDAVAYVGCGAGVHLVGVHETQPLAWVDTWDLQALVTDVKVRGRLLVVGLYGKRVEVFRLGTANSPEPVAGATTAKRPVQIWLSGDRLHVAEVGLPGSILCLAGIRCGFGNQVEVFELDEQAGTLDPVGTYASAWLRLPHAAFGAGVVLSPRPNGLKVYRAEALP